MVISLLGVTFYYWYNNTYYVRTEDARVDGAVVRISPQVTGKIISVNVEEGDRVVAGQALARLDDTLLAPGTNPDLAVVRAPQDGVIIKKIGSAGEIAAPGQPLLMMVDPYSLYVTANVEETKLSRVRPGQKVDVWVDAIPGQKFNGRVEKVGEASLSTFSLLPAANTSANFTKVVQRIPVKIVVEDFRGHQFLHGTNVYVKIHIK
ncbi:MAG: efflux RND transporter periplasmic adaptor subunit [Peptococcaceae bacterium]|nr:efflux RND transporter periplasmic adaptor subunit [Peptococcaceae bacterium]